MILLMLLKQKLMLMLAGKLGSVVSRGGTAPTQTKPRVLFTFGIKLANIISIRQVVFSFCRILVQ